MQQGTEIILFTVKKVWPTAITIPGGINHSLISYWLERADNEIFSHNYDENHIKLFKNCQMMKAKFAGSFQTL